LERELAEEKALSDFRHVQACEFQRQLEISERQSDLALAEARRDSERLDWLDRANAALNRHYGTNYGWRLILNHNVVRLMRDGRPSVSGSVSDIDLHDMEGGHRKSVSCRTAIDAAISGNQPHTGD
jgi:hypothetical protein